MFIIKHRAFFYGLSLILIIISICSMIKPGFNLGIDFTGGSITEVSYTPAKARPDKALVEQALTASHIEGFLIQPVGEDRYVVRTKELTDTEKATVMNALSNNSKIAMKEERSNSIGPTVGNDLRQKAYIAITTVVILIVLFVTFAFRKVSEPVPSWKYGLATIIALAHDVVIPAGGFIIISHFFGGDIDMLFVSALLAILGFSVHDTIVVFDRVRENLQVNKEHRVHEGFDETVGKSVTQTFGRSINTSLTIFIVLVVLYILGPETTRNFTLVLIIGIITGTYSSIFIASPLLVTFDKMKRASKSKK